MPLYYIGTDYHSDNLTHYGILGMKWYVRRFQNPDGSLTAEGRERYSNAKSTVKKAVGGIAVKGAKAVGKGAKAVGSHIVRKIKTKHPSLMTQDELIEYSRRLAAEKSVLDMREYIKSKSGSRARKVVGDIVEDGSKILARRAFDKLASEMFKNNADRYIEDERRKVEYDELQAKKKDLHINEIKRIGYEQEIARNLELASIYRQLSEPKPSKEEKKVKVYDPSIDDYKWVMKETKEFTNWKARQKEAEDRLADYNRAYRKFTKEGEDALLPLPTFGPSSKKK